MNENLNTVTLEAGGKVWELRLTHSVLKRISSRTRMPMSRFGEVIDRYDLMSVVMEELLRRVDPLLSDKQLAEILDELPPMEIGRLVNAAIAAAFPPAEEDTGEPEDGSPFGTGTRA